MFKFLFFISIILTLSNLSQAQKIDRIQKNFWVAVNQLDNKKIVYNGEAILKYVDDQKLEIDSNIIFIRLFLSFGYSGLGNFERSLQLNLQTKTFILNTWSKQSNMFISCLKSIALDYNHLKKYDKSLEIYFEIYEVQKSVLSDNKIAIIQSISDISTSYIDLGDSQKSIDYALLGLEEIKLTIDSSKVDLTTIYSTLYSNLSLCYSRQNDYKKALEFNLLALEKKNILFGDLSLSYILNLESISFNLTSLKNYQLALQYNLTSLELREKLFGKEDPKIIECLQNISFNYVNLKNYDKALEFDLKALKLKQKYFGEYHIATVNIIKHVAFDLKMQSRFNEALKFNQKALEIIKQNLGEYHVDYASSLNSVASDYFELGQYEKALELNLNALDIFNKTSNKKRPEYILTLNNIASIYSGLSNFRKSLDFNTTVLELTKINEGTESRNYALSLNNIAADYSNLGDFRKAIELNLEALKILLNIDSLSEDYALALHNLGQYYHESGDYKKGLEISFKALDFRKKIFGELHLDYAMNLNNIGSIYSDLGEYKMSIDYYQKSLDITQILLGKKHINYALGLNNLALNYQNIGKFEDALECYIRSLEIYKITLGSENPSYARVLQNLSTYYSTLGELTKALDLSLEALAIYKKSLGEHHFEYIMCLNNVASSYSDLGDFKKALELNFIVLQDLEKIVGLYHPAYIVSLVNLGETCSEMGDLNRALDLTLKAKNILKSSNNERSPEYAIVLNNLAIVFSKLGEFSKALEHLNESIDINEKIYGMNHLEYAKNLCNIATQYIYLGKYNNALTLSQKTLSILENSIGTENAEYAFALSNMAVSNNYIGHYKKSLEMNKKAYEIREKIFGKESLSVSQSLSNIAFDEYCLGDYENALKYNSLSLEYFENSSSNHNLDLVQILNNRALFFFRLKNFRESSNCLLSSSKVILQEFTANKFGLTDELNISFKKRVETNFCFLSTLLSIDNTIINDLNNIWINLNGNLSSEKSLMINKISKLPDSALIQKYHQLVRNKIIQNKILELPVIERNKNNLRLQQIEGDIIDIEILLSQHSKEFDDSKRVFNSNDISSNLESEEIFIDIARFKEYNFYQNKWSNGFQYIIFITNSKNSIIDFVYLKKGQDIEAEVLFDYKNETSDKTIASELKNEIFYNSFWKPIAEKIGDAKIVYVSLGGDYNNINLNTLYNPETGKYLIEEKDIRIVNSARDFVLKKERVKKQYATTTSVLYGFPDFNGNTTTSIDTTDYIAATRDLNKIWIDSLTRGGMKASPLPATKVEVEQIAGTFQKNGWSAQIYTGGVASETNIKQEESPRVLHVATHGYFFEDIPMDTMNNRFLGMDRTRVIQDPMLRSGLLFSGANKTLQGEETKGENGLLSAAEASLLDLRETELVVLSACETGKGEVKNSEGVYGLRKAFADAGAQNIIMSLWKVDDKVTQEFMTRFYDVWLNEKTTIREAFNRTQLEIKAKYPKPYYWGAFILVGE